MYVWPRVRRFYVEFLGRASREETYHALSEERAPPVYAYGRARTCVHTHVRMVRVTHRRRALVNLINPTDTSGTERGRPVCSVVLSTLMRTR